MAGFQGNQPEEIGVISAVPIFIMIVLNLFVGRIADRAGDWRSVIVAGSLVAGVVSLGFVFVDDFWGILIVNTLCVTAFMAIEPVIDAAAIRLTRRRGSDFALVRIWGTFGYIAITGIAGVLFGWIGIGVFVPLFIAMSLLRAGAALPLPFFRAPEVETKVQPPAGLPLVELSNSLKVVMRPWFVLTLAGTALLQASHMLLVSFGALLWVQAGVSEVTVGILWMIAPDLRDCDHARFRPPFTQVLGAPFAGRGLRLRRGAVGRNGLCHRGLADGPVAGIAHGDVWAGLYGHHQFHRQLDR